jgi:hypothetical protein
MKIKTCRALLLLPALALAMFPSDIDADGGTVQLRQEAGGFVITVFTSPAPLVAGPVDLSVMVQSKETLQPLLNATVDVRLRASSHLEIETHANRQLAHNKLLYAAPVNLPEAGEWEFGIIVSHDDWTATATGHFRAAQRSPGTAPWGYLAFPPAVMLIFALREFLIRCR